MDTTGGYRISVFAVLDRKARVVAREECSTDGERIDSKFDSRRRRGGASTAGTRPTVPVCPEDAPMKGVDEESTSKRASHRRCIVDVTLEGGGGGPHTGRGWQGARRTEHETKRNGDEEIDASHIGAIAHLILETSQHQIRPFSRFLRPHLCPRFTDRPLPRTTNRQLAASCNLTSSFMNVDWTTITADLRIAPDGRGTYGGGTTKMIECDRRYTTASPTHQSHLTCSGALRQSIGSLRILRKRNILCTFLKREQQQKEAIKNYQIQHYFQSRIICFLYCIFFRLICYWMLKHFKDFGDDSFVHSWLGQRWRTITPPCNHVIHNCATRPCTRDNYSYENSITLVRYCNVLVLVCLDSWSVY